MKMAGLASMASVYMMYEISRGLVKLVTKNSKASGSAPGPDRLSALRHTPKPLYFYLLGRTLTYTHTNTAYANQYRLHTIQISWNHGYNHNHKYPHHTPHHTHQTQAQTPHINHTHTTQASIPHAHTTHTSHTCHTSTHTHRTQTHTHTHRTQTHTCSSTEGDKWCNNTYSHIIPVNTVTRQLEVLHVGHVHIAFVCSNVHPFRSEWATESSRAGVGTMQAANLHINNSKCNGS